MGILKNKVIIITGATSGIGEATAIEAAREGAGIVVAGRREERGNAVAEEIRRQGGTAVFIQTDVRKEEDVKHLVLRTVEEYGRLDGAFNNAGILSGISELIKVPNDDFDDLMNVNVRSVFLSMKHEIPELKKNGGAIVNNASIAGTITYPNFGAYVTTKHAVIGLTKAAAIDYAEHGIRVNSVMPGVIETPIWEYFPDAEQRMNEVASTVPMKRAAKPLEVAKPVVFLLSQNASYITGTHLIVDGGYTAL